MLPLPSEIIAILNQFAPVFSRQVWPWAQVLVIGAILAPGKRTVTSVLRVMGLSGERQFQKYHRVLNRCQWSSLALSRILLNLLVGAFLEDEAPLVIGLDDTIERRRGEQIEAKGIYRDPVRSSQSHFVKTSGLRWVVMMLVVPIPWAARRWALPFLTALAPSEGYYAKRQRGHKPLSRWASQMIGQLRRWLPERAIVVVADSAYATLDLLAKCAGLDKPVTMVTRLRLDAALYDPAPPRTPQTKGRPRLKGARQPTLAQRLVSPQTVWESLTVTWYGGTQRVVEAASGTAVWYHGGCPPVTLRWVLLRDPQGRFRSQALLCTDTQATPTQVIEWFVSRWQLEVTFEETRAHLGVETQRQWSTLAIARTTPALFGLFSLITLMAHRSLQGHALPPRQAAWYTKELSTFSDTIAFVRSLLWPVPLFSMSLEQTDVVKIPKRVLLHLTDLLAFAA